MSAFPLPRPTSSRLTGAMAAAALAALALTSCAGDSDSGTSELQQTYAEHPVDEEVELDLAGVGLTEVSHALTEEEVTSEELVQAYTERIEALDQSGPALNAVRMLNPDAVEEAETLDAEREDGELRGPLHGVPVLIKDNIDVGGLPTTAGSTALADSVPEEDAALVESLREAGAIVLGKTNLSEFAYFMSSDAPAGYSSLGGQTLNPYDVTESPSGSSSGSGVAASVGLAAATVGTETSGSILLPAESNSVVGHKPTVGLISQEGMLPVSSTQDTAGPMTRSVEDAALLASVMTGPDAELDPGELAESVEGASLEGVRLGYLPSQHEAEDDGEDGQDGDPAGVAVYEDALQVLEDQGAELVEVDPLGATEADDILLSEFGRDLDEYLAQLPGDAPMGSLEEIIAYNEENSEAALKFGQGLLEEAAGFDLDDPAESAAYETDREEGLEQSRSSIDGTLEEEDLDAIVSDGSTVGLGARAAYPTVSVPSGYLDPGTQPASLMFLGTEWSDADLLGYAHSFEQAADVWQSPAEANPSLFRCTMDAVDSLPDACP